MPPCNVCIQKGRRETTKLLAQVAGMSVHGHRNELLIPPQHDTRSDSTRKQPRSPLSTLKARMQKQGHLPKSSANRARKPDLSAENQNKQNSVHAGAYYELGGSPLLKERQQLIHEVNALKGIRNALEEEIGLLSARRDALQAVVSPLETKYKAYSSEPSIMAHEYSTPQEMQRTAPSRANVSPFKRVHLPQGTFRRMPLFQDDDQVHEQAMDEPTVDDEEADDLVLMRSPDRSPSRDRALSHPQQRNNYDEYVQRSPRTSNEKASLSLTAPAASPSRHNPQARHHKRGASRELFATVGYNGHERVSMEHTDPLKADAPNEEEPKESQNGGLCYHARKRLTLQQAQSEAMHAFDGRSLEALERDAYERAVMRMEMKMVGVAMEAAVASDPPRHPLERTAAAIRPAISDMPVPAPSPVKTIEVRPKSSPARPRAERTPGLVTPSRPSRTRRDNDKSRNSDKHGGSPTKQRAKSAAVKRPSGTTGRRNSTGSTSGEDDSRTAGTTTPISKAVSAGKHKQKDSKRRSGSAQRTHLVW